FFRTHFVTVLGLCVVATVMAPDGTAQLWLLPCVLLAFLGAVSWILDHPPAGWTLLVLLAIAIVGNLILWEPLAAIHIDDNALIAKAIETPRTISLGPGFARMPSDLASAALLGFATTAMLVGHSYLISPGLTIRPLMGQILGLGIALLARTVVSGAALWYWA